MNETLALCTLAACCGFCLGYVMGHLIDVLRELRTCWACWPERCPE